jgi:hypothetical protein
MAGKHTLSDFKTALKGGGARPNLFQVTIPGTIPGGGFGNGEHFSILCKAAALPASNIAPIDVPFRGRIFKVAGDRTFDTWTITIINDEDFAIRKGMENWMRVIAQYADGSGATNPGGTNDGYMRKAKVEQLGRSASSTGNSASGGGLVVKATYEFHDIFPTNISQIDLSYDTSDTIEEFTVEFQVQYWTPFASSGSTAGTGG